MLKKILFSCLLFLYVTNVNASLKLPKYNTLFENISKSTLANLTGYKGKITQSEIKAAQKLAKAIEHLDQKRYGATLSLLNKTPRSSVLNSYISYYKALAYMGQNKAGKALKLLPVQTVLSQKIAWDRFWLRQDALASLKMSSELSSEISAVKKKYHKDKWVKIKSEFYLGKAAYLSGDKTLAKKYLHTVLIELAGTEFDHRIFSILKKTGDKKYKVLSESGWNKRAEKLIGNGFAYKATKIYEWYAQKKSGKTKNYYLEKVAYSTFKERRYKVAASLYEDLLSKGIHTSSKLEILLKIAQAHSRSDQFPEAIAAYEKIARSYPNTKSSATAKYKLGFISFDSMNYKKAIQYYEPFIKSTNRYRRENARWYRLWSFYLLKNYVRALEEVVALSMDSKRNKDKVQMLNYWQARIYEKMKQKDKAKELYKKTAAGAPLEYYSLLAKQRLRYGKLDSKTLLSANLFNFVPHVQKNNSDDGKPLDLSNVQKKDPLIRAILLSHIGLDTYAYQESQSSNHKNEYHIKTVKRFAAAGNYRRGYSLRKMAISGSLNGTNRTEGYKAGFPQAYAKYIEPYTDAWQIKPSLAYAIMRQESAFMPEAMSFAYAYGLMQIIPPTANEIAQNIKFAPFEIGLLNKPKINTLFGTYYLKYLSDTFQKNIIYTIGGYNAGPNALKRWSAKAGDLDSDEFIELIPYRETKKYVKRVLVNYMVYERLYGK
jgi:soluble lytic murein transglycosylase-like protein